MVDYGGIWQRILARNLPCENHGQIPAAEGSGLDPPAPAQQLMEYPSNPLDIAGVMLFSSDPAEPLPLDFHFVSMVWAHELDIQIGFGPRNRGPTGCVWQADWAQFFLGFCRGETVKPMDRKNLTKTA